MTVVVCVGEVTVILKTAEPDIFEVEIRPNGWRTAITIIRSGVSQTGGLRGLGGDQL